MMTLASRLMCKYRRARCQGHTSKESLISCLEKAPANWSVSRYVSPYWAKAETKLYNICEIFQLLLMELKRRKLADELLLRSSKNGTAFVTAVLMKGCLVKKSWGYKSQMILYPGIGNENAEEFAFSKIACINSYGKRHGLYKQISNMCCRCTLTSVKLISVHTWEWY
ncbi:unnamed protein product [Sphagnum balticum]